MFRQRLFLLSLFLLFAAACQAQQPAPTALPLPTPTPTASPLPTPTSIPLEARVDPQLDLDHLAPYAPFVVQFNQPVSLSSAGRIVVSPDLEGAVTWNEAHTRLTFVPQRGFAPATTYRITLGDYTSASGAGFTAPQQWEIRTLDHPRVVNRQPSQLTWPLADRRPAIQLVFDREMDRASVNAALSVQPPVPLDTHWQALTLTLQPREPLMPGVQYTFMLTQTATDIHGVPLGENYGWGHWTRDLVADKTWPARQGDRSTPLVIRFNYPVNADSAQQALAIEPAIKGKITWSQDQTVITMTPDSLLPSETQYTLRFDKPLRDAAGGELPAPAPMSFTTPPAILAVTPNKPMGVHPVSTIKITFDRLMDHAKTEAAFQITPTVPGRFEWNETTLTFYPSSSYLDEWTDYTVTVSDTARDLKGEPVLRQPYTWSFSTGEYQDTANFGWGPNAQVVDADGRRAIQFQSMEADLTPLNFELYRLSVEQFLDRYSSNFKSSDGKKRPISIQGALLAKRWQIKTAPSDNSHGRIREVVIPQDVPPGLYILNLTTENVNDQLLLIVTRHTLVLKQAEKQIVAWVTDINGGPIADIEVLVYARDGKLISQGRTDENGVYRAQSDRDPQPLIVIARKDQDVTAAGFDNEWQSREPHWWDWWKPAPQALSYAAHIYTDRPIYRPGQTVFFKGIIRKDDDAVIGLPTAGLSVTVRIRDARNNVVRTLHHTVNELGAVAGEFQLAEGAMLGEYAVEMVMGGESHRQIFKVQDYRKPDYQVSVTTNAAQYVMGDTISATVDSRYFFGEPAPNAKLNVKLYKLVNRYYWEEPPENDNDLVWYRAEDQDIYGITDANGRYAFSLDAVVDKNSYPIYWASSLKSSTWGIEATVDDGSHQTVSGLAVVKVYDAAEKVHLDMSDYFQTPGQPFTIQAGVTTISDKPVSGRTLTLSLRRYNAQTHDYSTVVQSSKLTTGADGKASLPFTVQEPGYYQLYLTGADRMERKMSVESWIYVFSGASRWTVRQGSDLGIAADRSSYAPGDTARLLIESTFSGPALLTFERGTTRRERLIQLTAPLTRVDAPIQPDDAPNIHVTVNAWVEPNPSHDRYRYYNAPDSQLRTASVELRVPVADKTLKVTITPGYGTPGGAARAFAPREKVAFTVRVANARGEPVSAEVSLALVDEAIFRLSNELSGPIFDAFYHRRDNIVYTYDAMALIRSFPCDCGGGGMGGGGGDGGGIAANPRSNFPDTAAWFPVLRTDEKGEATVAITLPDNLTSWRITAKAVTANTEVGETFINITTHQPIIVRPILPRSLTAGDQVELSALIHNYGNRPRDIAVSIQAPALQIKSQITQTITLTPGEIRGVGWSVLATPPLSKTGEGMGGGGEVTVTVRALPLPLAGEGRGGGGDAVRLTLPVRPLAVPDVATQIGEFSGELSTTIAWPAGALDLSGVKLQLNRSIAGTLFDGLEYLTGYPFG